MAVGTSFMVPGGWGWVRVRKRIGAPHVLFPRKTRCVLSAPLDPLGLLSGRSFQVAAAVRKLQRRLTQSHHEMSNQAFMPLVSAGLGAHVCARSNLSTPLPPVKRLPSCTRLSIPNDVFVDPLSLKLFKFFHFFKFLICCYHARIQHMRRAVPDFAGAMLTDPTLPSGRPFQLAAAVGELQRRLTQSHHEMSNQAFMPLVSDGLGAHVCFCSNASAPSPLSPGRPSQVVAAVGMLQRRLTQSHHEMSNQAFMPLVSDGMDVCSCSNSSMPLAS
jgi:hypothetical protein